MTRAEMSFELLFHLRVSGFTFTAIAALYQKFFSQNHYITALCWKTDRGDETVVKKASSSHPPWWSQKTREELNK